MLAVYVNTCAKCYIYVAPDLIVTAVCAFFSKSMQALCTITKRQPLLWKLHWKSFVIHVWDLLHKTSLKASGMLSVIYATLWLIATVTMCSDVWWLSAHMNTSAQSVKCCCASNVSQHPGFGTTPWRRSWRHLTTSTELDMCFFFGSVCFFVCLVAGLGKKYWPDFHETWWKVVARAKEELVRFWWWSESLGDNTAKFLLIRLWLGYLDGRCLQVS